MARLGQGDARDLKKARGSFTKGLSKEDRRCYAELAMLSYEEGDLPKAMGHWRSYFFSPAFIHNQTYLEPEIDRVYYAVRYVEETLEGKVQPVYLDRLLAFQQDILSYFQERVDQEKLTPRKLAYGQSLLVLKGVQDLFLEKNQKVPLKT
jgi:hypothetical protein